MDSKSTQLVSQAARLLVVMISYFSVTTLPRNSLGFF